MYVNLSTIKMLSYGGDHHTVYERHHSGEITLLRSYFIVEYSIKSAYTGYPARYNKIYSHENWTRSIRLRSEKSSCCSRLLLEPQAHRRRRCFCFFPSKESSSSSSRASRSILAVIADCSTSCFNKVTAARAAGSIAWTTGVDCCT